MRSQIFTTASTLAGALLGSVLIGFAYLVFFIHHGEGPMVEMAKSDLVVATIGAALGGTYGLVSHRRKRRKQDH